MGRPYLSSSSSCSVSIQSRPTCLRDLGKAHSRPCPFPLDGVSTDQMVARRKAMNAHIYRHGRINHYIYQYTLSCMETHVPLDVKKRTMGFYVDHSAERSHQTEKPLPKPVVFLERSSPLDTLPGIYHFEPYETVKVGLMSS